MPKNKAFIFIHHVFRWRYNCFMRWLLPMAAFAALLVLAQGSQAQGRGGSGHSSAGFSGGHSGFSRPAVAHSGPGFSRSGSGTSRVGVQSSAFAPQNRTGFIPRRFASNGFDRGFDHRGFDRNGRGFDHRGFDRNGRGFDRFHHRFANPFIFSGGCIHGNFFGGFPCRNFLFGDSFVWGYAPLYASYPFGYDYLGYNSGYNNPPPPQQPVVEQSSNDSQLAYEVGRLSGEVEQLRSEQAQVQASENPQASAERHPQLPRSSESAVEPTTNVTLVFRDGKKMSVENYAIVGQTLWVLSSRTARRIPLSDLDLPATKQVNEENGTEIHLPNP
jgi:hypothetical protein